MSVSNGELANETTFNTSFMSREIDTGTVGKVDLSNTDPLSGTAIVNLQKNINALASALGISPNQVQNYLVSWASTVVGLSSSDVVDKVEALVARFTGTGGHVHTGVDGESSRVSASDLANYNDYWCIPQRITFNGAAGLNDDVTAIFATKTSGGGSAAAGVLTDNPNNRVALLNATTQTGIEDGEGQAVYGRLTYSAGVWTLTYYTNEAGVETAHSLATQDIVIIYREVFTSALRPTLGLDPADTGTLDVTADVVDASATQRGLVSTGAQAFAGDKTFNDDLIVAQALRGFETVDASTTGAGATLPYPNTPAVRLTNASLVSISRISGQLRGHFLALVNDTGGTVTIQNDTGATPAERILTGRGADFKLRNGASVLAYYENNSQRWRLLNETGLINTDDLTEGSTNLYFTNARAIAAVVVQTILAGQTTTSPSQDAVATALSGKNASIQFRDEGSALGASGTVDEVDFTGAGVTASRVGNKVTVNVAAGGGGGGALKWYEDVNAPIEVADSFFRFRSFEQGLGQSMYCLFKVPDTYTAGVQVFLKTAFKSAGTSGTVQIQTVTTLIRMTSDLYTSTTNQRTSTNSAVTLSGATQDKFQALSLDLTDNAGAINSVAIAAGDYILIKITRNAADSATSTAEVAVEGSEVKAS